MRPLQRPEHALDSITLGNSVPPNQNQLSLAGDIRTRDMELEATGRITDQVRLHGGYSYLDTELVAGVISNEGNKQYSIPRHKFSLFGQYAFTGDGQRLMRDK